jgi:hypothetical protein
MYRRKNNQKSVNIILNYLKPKFLTCDFYRNFCQLLICFYCQSYGTVVFFLMFWHPPASVRYIKYCSVYERKDRMEFNFKFSQILKSGKFPLIRKMCWSFAR